MVSLQARWGLQDLNPLGLSQSNFSFIPILFPPFMLLPVPWLLLSFFKVLALVLSYNQGHIKTFIHTDLWQTEMKKCPLATSCNLPFTVQCNNTFLPLCSIQCDSKLNQLMWFKVMSVYQTIIHSLLLSFVSRSLSCRQEHLLSQGGLFSVLFCCWDLGRKRQFIALNASDVNLPWESGMAWMQKQYVSKDPFLVVAGCQGSIKAHFLGLIAS